MDRLIALNQLLCQVLGSVAGLLVQVFHVFVIFVLLFLILVQEKLVGEVRLRQHLSLRCWLLRGLWIAVFRPRGFINLIFLLKAHIVAISIMCEPSSLDLFGNLVASFRVKGCKHLSVEHRVEPVLGAVEPAVELGYDPNFFRFLQETLAGRFCSFIIFGHT